MKRKMFFLFLGLFLLSYSFFMYLKLADLTNLLTVERTKLLRISRELSYRKEKVKELEEIISNENLKLFSERAALEQLLRRVEKLKKNYGIEIVGNLQKENSLWKLSLILEFTPKSAQEITKTVEDLLQENAPLADIEGLLIDTGIPRVSVKVTLIQPFSEVVK